MMSASINKGDKWEEAADVNGELQTDDGFLLLPSALLFRAIFAPPPSPPPSPLFVRPLHHRHRAI